MAILNGKYRVKNSKNDYDIVYLETGANQVKFNDGKTFQEKLEDGTLKGDKGDKGDTGITPTIKAGSVTTGSSGSSATVTASTVGTTTTFNFVIPQGIKGDTGAKGDKGDQGIQGVKGDKGDKGEDGLTTSITVGSTKYTHSNGNITIPAYPTLSSLGASASSHTHSQYENQNAFSSVKVGSTTVTADSPTDTIELKAGSNITLTPDSTNDAITIAVNGMTVTSSEKSDWNAKETTSGSQAKADKAKSDAISSAKSYTDEKVAQFIDSAPETLDTLNELAKALGNDPNFATTVATQIGTKADTSYVNTELDKKANASHGTHVTYSTTAPLSNGTASVGTSGSVSRGDHVHPLQTTVSGNAGTATTLQTARTINGTSFNGSANITTANWGTARNITIGNATKSVNGSGNVSWTLAEIGASSTSVATTSANGLMSAQDKTKLDSIATNSQFKITVASSSWTTDGSLYSTTIKHNLNKEVLYVSAYDSSSKKSIFVSYTITDNNSLKVTVESAINAVITIVVEGGLVNLAGGGISDSTVSATSTWSSTKIESAMSGLVKDGTTSQKGIVQLSSAINSTSTTLGATASAVKLAYDLANTANNLANTVNNSTNNQRTITMSTADPSGGKDGDIWFKYE